jgi:hypothetical protein
MSLAHHVDNDNDTRIKKLLAEGKTPAQVELAYAGELQPGVAGAWAESILRARAAKTAPAKAVAEAPVPTKSKTPTKTRR